MAPLPAFVEAFENEVKERKEKILIIIDEADEFARYSHGYQEYKKVDDCADFLAKLIDWTKNGEATVILASSDSLFREWDVAEKYAEKLFFQRLTDEQFSEYF